MTDSCDYGRSVGVCCVFKQKTAYERRMSDWSSDVYSSDLSAGIAARVFADTVPDPTVASVDAGVAFLREGEHDSVVGFGGGSPLDSAKAVALLGQHGGEMADHTAPHVQDAPGKPVLAIPPTAGTG